jgi:hypothetical protein
MMWSIGERSARRERVMSCAFLGKVCGERKTGVPARTFAAAIMAIAALAQSSPPTFAGPMELSGTFAVSESGGATYSIPIAVPPGTAGMTPNLSLGYDSQRGSGIVGVGWSLNGFSAIRRCAETRAQDPAALSNGRVGFDAADRFCLDGQRLMVITGTYGANLSEYRTEIEGFKKVTANGTAGTGPSWFEVRLPSGRVLQYGNTPDSKILAKGKTSVRVWALNRITDTKGNYLTITYSNDTTNGTYYPTRIDYTGNTAAALATYASVQFSYVARPATDQVLAYTAGSSVKLTQQLSEIKTYTGGSQVLSYKLVYETAANTATGVSRLTSVQMCDAANLCQPATTFTWSNAAGAAVGYGPSQDWLAAPGTAASSKPVVAVYGSFSGASKKKKNAGSAPNSNGDINGDGRSDVLINNNGALSVSISTGTGLAPHTALGITAYSPQLIDIFGTGRDDIVALNASNQLVRFANNGSGGFSTTPTVLKAIGVTHPVFPDIYTPIVSDLNGDGLPDISWHTTQNVFYFALNNGSGFGANQTITPPSNVNGTICQTSNICTTVRSPVSVQFANLRGRGNVDLVFTYQSVIPKSCSGNDDNMVCNGYTTADNPGPHEVWTSTWTGSAFSAPAKLLSVAQATVLQRCGGTNESPISCPNVFPPLTTRVGDVNGDGLSDLYISHPATSTNKGSWPANQFLYVGNGNGFNSSVAPGFAATSCGNGIVFKSLYALDRTDAVCGQGDLIRIARPNAAATAYGALASLITQPATGGWWLGDFNGDGYFDILTQRAADNHYWVALSTRIGGAAVDRLTGITTGLGATTTITYDAPSSNATANGLPIYTRGTTGAYPTVDEVPDDYVVTRVERSNGIGGTFASAYRYEGWQRDLRGRGTRGPTKVIATDLGTGIQTATTYRLDYPYTGLLKSEVKSVGAVTLSNVTNTHAATNLAAGTTRFLPLLDVSVATASDLDGSPLPSVTTDYDYDAFGNPTLVTSSASDGFSKSTSTTYSNDTTRWILGLPTQSQVTQTTTP